MRTNVIEETYMSTLKGISHQLDKRANLSRQVKSGLSSIKANIAPMKPSTPTGIPSPVTQQPMVTNVAGSGSGY
jgi:hypothetical protein